MPYIIDGNNLMGCFPEVMPEEPDARSVVLEVLEKFQEKRKNNVTIVFDGVPEGGVRLHEISPKFTVIYPRNGSSADDEIMELLEDLHYFKDVILVTSDRALKKFARKKGAKTINSIEFYFELKRYSAIHGHQEQKRKRIESELSDQEVDQWMKIFEKQA